MKDIIVNFGDGEKVLEVQGEAHFGRILLPTPPQLVTTPQN